MGALTIKKNRPTDGIFAWQWVLGRVVHLPSDEFPWVGPNGLVVHSAKRRKAKKNKSGGDVLALTLAG